MNFFSDLARVLYDFKGMAVEVSRRGAGAVFGTLLLLSAVYGIGTGIWYADATTDFLTLLAKEAKTQAPEFSIKNGVLSSPVQQPFVLTEHSLSDAFFTDIAAWVQQRFHRKVPGDKEWALGWMGGEQSRLFCLVLDTTDTYRSVVKPEEYQAYVIAGKESIKALAREQGVQRVREAKYAETQTQPIDFKPAAIRPELVREQAAGPLRAWFASMSVLFTLLRFAGKALLVAVLGLLLNALMSKGFSFGRLYALGVYALVPVVIFGLIKVMAMPYPGIILFLMHLVFGLVPVVMAPSEESASA